MTPIYDRAINFLNTYSIDTEYMLNTLGRYLYDNQGLDLRVIEAGDPRVYILYLDINLLIEEMESVNF